MRCKSGFTLIELMVVIIVGSMVSGVLYKIIQGTFGTYSKTQTKLTNLRAGSLLLEHFKNDIRLATIDAPKMQINGEDLTYTFNIRKSGMADSIPVTYKYENGVVRRIGDSGERVISQAKVASFSITQGENSFGKYLNILIITDADKDESDRAISNRSNQVTLRAVLFPKFFKSGGKVDAAEKYWNAARSLNSTGGTS